MVEMATFINAQARITSKERIEWAIRAKPRPTWMQYRLLCRLVRLAFQECHPGVNYHTTAFTQIDNQFKLRVRQVDADGTLVGVCCGHMAAEIADTFRALGKHMLVVPVYSWDMFADAVPDVLLLLVQQGVSYENR